MEPSGVTRIRPSASAYRFDMRTRDRDTSTGRQRKEVAGMRSGGP